MKDELIGQVNIIFFKEILYILWTRTNRNRFLRYEYSANNKENSLRLVCPIKFKKFTWQRCFQEKKRDLILTDLVYLLKDYWQDYKKRKNSLLGIYESLKSPAVNTWSDYRNQKLFEKLVLRFVIIFLNRKIN